MYERYFFVISLVISAGITGTISFLTHMRRKNRESRVFSLLLLAITIYCLGYALELQSDTLPKMLFWSNFQYLGIICISPLWLILALLYNGLERWLTRRKLGLLFLIPCLTLVIKYFNPYHLYYIHIGVNFTPPFPVFAPKVGLWYWVNSTYQILTLLTGMLLFLLMGRRENPLYRHQIAVILIGFLFPWIAFLFHLSGYSPWHIDLIPFALIITSIFVLCGFNYYHLFDIIPIAWTKVFESLHDGVLVLDNQSRIVELNATANRMLNLQNDSLGLKITDALSAVPQLGEQVTGHLEQIVIQTKNDNREQFLESKLFTITDSFNIITGYTIILTDKSEQIRLLNRLQTLATIDSLTEIKNRRFFFEKCRQELTRIQSQALPVSFVLIDLDRFKEINDTYGHQTGDIVLKQTVKRLMPKITAPNIFGRVGGEEFAVFLPECLIPQAQKIAERLLQALLEAPINVNSLQLQITASFGVSGDVNSTATNLDLLFSQADEALYRSKANGRKMVTIF
jgi:diguanylate cyclase (GGDEF)-like protein